jgi:hypothetical protein
VLAPVQSETGKEAINRGCHGLTQCGWSRPEA